MSLKAYAALQLLLLLLALHLKHSLATGSSIVPQKTSQPAQQQQPQQQQHQPQQQQQHQPQQVSLHPQHSHTHTLSHSHPHQPPAHLPANIIQNVQYVHEKESDMQDILKNTHTEEDFSDPYQYLNEPKYESRLPWNPFTTDQHSVTQPLPATMGVPLTPYAFEAGLSALQNTPKYMPFLGMYPQPVFVPYPLYIAAAPEMLYPGYSGTNSIELDESMSRAANSRRPPAASASGSYARNSPIYYVRLPPMPYMFLPNLGYASAPAAATFAPNLAAMPQYTALPTFSAYSSVFNLPMSFVGNGKPTGIYQMSTPPADIPGALQFAENSGYGLRPPPPPPPPSNVYRPMSGAAAGYLPQPPYGGMATAPSAPAHQDSKMTLLKRPFVFNGRPEDIYVLPNSFSPLYADSGYY